MFTKKNLKNNLEFIKIPMQGTRTATILVLIKTGSRYETRTNNGISHFLEHMFFKGTKNRPTTFAISSELDSLGAEFNAFTGKEYTGYWIKVRGDKIETAIDMVSDMLLNSKFSAREIEAEKGVIVEEINMYEDNPMMKISDVFEQCLYGDTPLGWGIAGTKDNVRQFKRKDFIDYFHSQYRADNTKIILAGDLRKNCDAQIQKYFAPLMQEIKKFEKTTYTKISENQTKPQSTINFKKCDQVVFSLGVRSVPLGHKYEFPLRVLASILGGAMSSRLFIEVRERRGLAYYVSTQNNFLSDTGYLTTQAGVTTEKTSEAIKIILTEYQKISQKLVNAQELNKVKDMIIGKSILQLESSDTVASWYGRQALKDKIITPNQFLNKIKKISAFEIRAAAQEIFQNENLNLAVIGPFRNKKEFDGILKF